ncbi:MAG TPA: HAD hydrolase-like protein [Dehalococcoidia bacterium]|nr:HAD hydrolase-like protein [Dehalococcoidia bacterium]
MLFDLDQTLLRTGGAGVLAMNRAFQEMFGIADALADIPYAGRTDPSILRDALRKHGIDGDFERIVAEFKERYVRHLERTLWETQGHVLPGIPHLLAALSSRRDVALGLATGNFREGAQLKLRRYGLDGHFRHGAYGDDAEDRAELVALAAHRTAQGEEPARVLVVGDTPLDVAAALACGFVPVGVATGYYSQDDLRQAGAALVFPDLSDWQRALSLLLP